MLASEKALPALHVTSDSAQSRTDESLMLAYRDGDASAFDRLYLRHRDSLFRFVLRQVGRQDLADELFQDVWIRLIDSAHRYRPSARFRTYLFRIARNRVIDYYRAHRTTPLELPDQVPDETEAADALTDRQRLAARLSDALGTLPLEQRSTVLLRLHGDLSLPEIADICGCGRETVKSRLRYAFAHLREVLGDYDAI